MKADAIKSIDRAMIDLAQQKQDLIGQSVTLMEQMDQLDSAIARLEDAKRALDNGKAKTAKGRSARTKPADRKPLPPSGRPEAVIAFLKAAPEPQNIDAIATGTGLPHESVRRVVYRSAPKHFDRKRVPGKGVVFWLKKTGDESRPTSRPTGDLAGATIFKAAQVILRDSSVPMFFQDVADAAEARGYTSGRGGNSGRSFRSIMERNSNVFKRAGKGFFDLTDVAKARGSLFE